MKGTSEDIVAIPSESNQVVTGIDALQVALRWVVERSGTDRGFLVSGDTGASSAAAEGPRILASWGRRMSDIGPPSRSVVARALAARRKLVVRDAGTDPRLMDAISVRGMGLGGILATTLRTDRGASVLVLDAIEPLPRSAEQARAAIDDATLLLEALLAARPLPKSDPPLEPSGTDALVGDSAAFRETLARALRAAATPFPVLLLGETGTGKEGLARRIHAESPRRDRPFVAVNCAAIPDALLESELYGSIRGAFTGSERDRTGLFRTASGGTLFLDEVGDLAPSAQAKLLRVLQEGRVRPVGADREVDVDVRVVAATHRELSVTDGTERFRPDLYHRLAYVTLRIPPLRERLEDLPELVRCLVGRLAVRSGLPAVTLGPEALDRLAAYAWPGNVRELEAVLAGVLVDRPGEVVEARHLELPTSGWAHPSTGRGTNLESRMIADALRAERGRIAAAARRIGWTRQKLYRRMASQGMTAPETGRRLFDDSDLRPDGASEP